MSENKKYIVGDYMKPNAPTVHESATFKEAVGVARKKETNGLVVVNDDNKVVGILSTWDLIEHLVPDYLEDDKHLAAFEAGDIFAQRLQEIADDSITLFMTSPVHTVKKHRPMIEAATLMSEFKIRQLPVVDDDDVLVGYMNRTDIKRAMAEVLGLE